MMPLIILGSIKIEAEKKIVLIEVSWETETFFPTYPRYNPYQLKQ